MRWALLRVSRAFTVSGLRKKDGNDVLKIQMNDRDDYDGGSARMLRFNCSWTQKGKALLSRLLCSVAVVGLDRWRGFHYFYICCKDLLHFKQEHAMFGNPPLQISHLKIFCVPETEFLSN